MVQVLAKVLHLLIRLHGKEIISMGKTDGMWTD